VSDILDQIDAAVEERCACGCGSQLSPTGPSAYYASETCQQRWRYQQLDPERARRLAERAKQRQAARLERAVAHELIRSGQTTTLDQEQITAAVHEAQFLLADFADRLRPVVQAIGRAVEEFLAQLPPILAARGDSAPPADPRERALWHVRNRNTGPQAPHRAPRRIDPRKGR
jgi:phosphatidylserine/phosphatidylglycerophosphate/cardiolipin synthase-like enzyme